MNAEDRVLKNITQVRDYLVGEGYKATHYRVEKALERHELKPRRGGGFTTSAAMKWAQSFLTPAVNAHAEADAPSGESGEDYGVSEAKARMQIKNLEEDHRRKVFDNDRETGRYTLTETFTAELGARARAFRLGLERFGTEQAESVAEIFGGSAGAAKELAKRLGMEGEEAHKAQVLIQDFCLERSQRFASRWMERVEGFLDPYATGHWWTDDMRESWEQYQRHNGNGGAQ